MKNLFGVPDEECLVIDDCSASIGGGTTTGATTTTSSSSTSSTTSITRSSIITSSSSTTSSKEEILICTMDVHECTDGTFVSRVPENKCQFASCTDHVITITTDPPPQTTTRTTSSQAVATSAYSTECEWHINTGYAPNTCTNTGSYPSDWDNIPEEFRHNYFFETAEECCEKSLFGVAGEECLVIDDCSANNQGGTMTSTSSTSSSIEATTTTISTSIATSTSTVTDSPSKQPTHSPVTIKPSLSLTEEPSSSPFKKPTDARKFLNTFSY